MGMGGLFPSYVEWCKSAGFFALSRNRFLQELQGCAAREGGEEIGGRIWKTSQGSARVRDLAC